MKRGDAVEARRFVSFGLTSARAALHSEAKACGNGCARGCSWPCANSRVARPTKVPSLRVKIVKRSDDMKGFVVLTRRWVAERTFSWFGRIVASQRTTKTSPISSPPSLPSPRSTSESDEPQGRKLLDQALRIGEMRFRPFHLPHGRERRRPGLDIAFRHKHGHAVIDAHLGSTWNLPERAR
jgi:hypothetical protein